MRWREGSAIAWRGCVVFALAWGGRDAFAGWTSGSDGSDGNLDCAWLNAHTACDHNICTFNCSQGTPCACTIDLGHAQDATWDTPGTGVGVYDSHQWAVVYKFGTINVPAYVTIKFLNHRSGAPVVWLAEGDITIAGLVQLSGQGASSDTLPSYAVPGPGGFQGGTRGAPNFSEGSAGFGPGGGGDDGCGGTYAFYGCGSVYGNPDIMPLIGGSGGGATALSSYSGASGGGAILIATDGALTVSNTGAIAAVGGNNNNGSGAGSGGAIRLMAGTSLSMAGNLAAYGGYGADSFYYPEQGYPCTQNGRILLESPAINVTGVTSPSRIQGFNCPPPALKQYNTLGSVFPPDDAPVLEVVSVNGAASPADPRAGILTPDVEIDSDNSVLVVVRAKNVPVGTNVTIRIAPERGRARVAQAELDAPQADGYSYGSANLAFPPGRSEIQLQAKWTP